MEKDTEEKLGAEWDWITEDPCTIEIPSNVRKEDLEEIARLELKLKKLNEQLKREKAKYEIWAALNKLAKAAINKVKQ